MEHVHAEPLKSSQPLPALRGDKAISVCNVKEILKNNKKKSRFQRNLKEMELWLEERRKTMDSPNTNTTPCKHT